MSADSCQTCAQQARDVLAYTRTFPPGIVGATPAQLRGVGRGGGQGFAQGKYARTGPGCASVTCNAAANEAVGVMDYAGRFRSGMPGATRAQLLGMRTGLSTPRGQAGNAPLPLGGGFRLNGATGWSGPTLAGQRGGFDLGDDGLASFGTFDRCSSSDRFAAPTAASIAADYTTFLGVWPETKADSQIADNTVQFTRAVAYGDRHLSSRETYPVGSIRLYLSAQLNGGLGEEYSLISPAGGDFDVEYPPVQRLGEAEGQAESYLARGGKLWMYYNANGSDGQGIYAKTSMDGLNFATETATGATGLNQATVGYGGLTGLSVVQTSRSFGPATYRGYFGNELGVVDGDTVVYSATSTDLQNWALDPAATGGILIGPGGSSAITSNARQPFALKRNDPIHPACVTLFYYHPPEHGQGTRIWYSTATDGTNFEYEYELDLGDQAVAGPTVLDISDAVWSPADHGAYLLFNDVNVDTSRYIQVRELVRA